jgi:hypothetical protein
MDVLVVWEKIASCVKFMPPRSLFEVIIVVKFGSSDRFADSATIETGSAEDR